MTKVEAHLLRTSSLILSKVIRVDLPKIDDQVVRESIYETLQKVIENLSLLCDAVETDNICSICDSESKKLSRVKKLNLIVDDQPNYDLSYNVSSIQSDNELVKKSNQNSIECESIENEDTIKSDSNLQSNLQNGSYGDKSSNCLDNSKSDESFIAKAFSYINFLKDKDRVDPNSLSLTRSTAFFISMALTFSFLYNSYKGMIQDMTYLMYPLGIIICFAPALFNRVVDKIIRR